MGGATVFAPEVAIAAATSLSTTWGLPVASSVAELAQGGAAAGALTIEAAKPLGFVELASAAVIVAGDEEVKDLRCWEQILHIDEDGYKRPAGFDNDKVEFHRKHGIFLHELAHHGKVLKNNAGHFILKNAYEEHFGFSISLVVPDGMHEEKTNRTMHVIVVHAVPVSLK